jgi:hypothetical protein
VDQKKEGPVDENGKVFWREGHGRTDQIGWLVPAVPAPPPGDGFWGYTSVPDEGCRWWRALPNCIEVAT